MLRSDPLGFLPGLASSYRDIHSPSKDPLTHRFFQIHRNYSFLDYILGGCQLMFTVRPLPVTSLSRVFPQGSGLCHSSRDLC